MWQKKGIHEKVWVVQDSFQRVGQPRIIAGNKEIVMVRNK